MTPHASEPTTATPAHVAPIVQLVEGGPAILATGRPADPIHHDPASWPSSTDLDRACQRASAAWATTDAISELVNSIPRDSTDTKLMRARDAAVKAWQAVTTTAQLLTAVQNVMRKARQ